MSEKEKEVMKGNLQNNIKDMDLQMEDKSQQIAEIEQQMALIKDSVSSMIANFRKS
jgi:hypothetical protein